MSVVDDVLDAGAAARGYPWGVLRSVELVDVVRAAAGLRPVRTTRRTAQGSDDH